MEDHKKFHVNQAAILLNGEGAILLLAHAETGKWLLPGGRLEEEDTSPLDGLRREICEETGITEFEVNGIQEVGFSDSKSSYLVLFVCGTLGKPTIILSDEHGDYAWVKSEDIDKFDYWHPKISDALHNYFTQEHVK